MNGYFLLIILIVALVTVSRIQGLTPVENSNNTDRQGQTAP
jgi:hypothetical protein